MADVLKQTLFWAGNPTFTPGGVGSESRAITAAESHDASDATYEGLAVSNDFSDPEFPAPGSGSSAASRSVQTATVDGTISFLRVKTRARVTSGGEGSGTLQPRINGTNRGSAPALTGSFANASQDFTTDPADSGAWTNAKVNAQTFGVELTGFCTAAAPDTADVRLAEFSLELWGPDVQVSTPASVALDLVPNAGLVTPGPVSSSPASVQLTLTPNAGTPVAGLRVVSPESVAAPLTVPEGVFGLTGLRDPAAVVAQGTTLDQLAALVTVRSAKASLADQTVTTYDRFTSPASWPNSGTQLQPLYTGSTQGVQGSSGAGNGIQGTGLIGGIKLFALVRLQKSAAGSALSSIRFGTAMGPKSLVTTPTIYDFATTPDDTMFALVQTNLIPTGQFGNPFTWGNGTDSVWASLFGWTFNHTYSNPSSGQFTRVDVAEAWVEIHGPLGTEPERIELTHVIDAVGKVVPMTRAV